MTTPTTPTAFKSFRCTDDLEQIIEEMKVEGQIKESERGDGETAADNEHKRVMEAVGGGLLQVHGITPNTKQLGIFQLMGENCNGFNNRIGGNSKIAKALNIKEELDINCLMYCKHRINFRHKDNKNDLTSSKCSRENWHARPLQHTMFTRASRPGGSRKEAPATFALERNRLCNESWAR
jgi:hypothetical protein